MIHIVQVFSDVQETVMETVSRLEAVETLVRAEEDAESLNSVDTASNTPPSPAVISRSRRVNKRVTINVGGVRWDTVTNFHDNNVIYLADMMFYGKCLSCSHTPD